MSAPSTYTLKTPTTDTYLKEITITPANNTINRGDNITIDVKTAGDVRSVEVKIPEMGIYPLERTTA